MTALQTICYGVPFAAARRCCLLLLSVAVCGWPPIRGRAAWQGTPVVTVSAASFEVAPVAPESIVAAFGANLAVRIETANTLPLPTQLAGTTVRVNGQLAPLFFVSPTQVNCLIPAGTATGTATMTITNGSGTASTGTVRIAPVAPALFTANADGQGVPAAVALRLRADGAQSFEPASPLSLGPDGEQVFLLLFGTGVRGRANLNDVSARLGGVDLPVLFAGAAPGFVGLDQLNVGPLPRELIGRGKVNLALSVNGFGSSNQTEIDITGAVGAVESPQINGYSRPLALAGEPLEINGSGFDAIPANNLVRVAGLEAKVTAATGNRLVIRVPFGAETGRVSVRTPRGEGVGREPLLLRTSISGVIEDTRGQPLAGIVVRLLGTNFAATTTGEGLFILPDAPPALSHDVEIDGTTAPGALPYPKVRLKLRVRADRDNQLSAPVALQQVSGPSLQVGSFTASAAAAAPAQQPGTARIQTGNVIFDVPGGVTARFPDGATTGLLTLTIVENSRTPVNLPPGTFSSTVAQLSPFGVRLSPGGKLTFPNSDGFPAGTQARLFRLDQTPNSPTLGSFIAVGAAAVSADGQRIETAVDAVTDTSIYFVAVPRPTTTVAGRVVESDRTTPVRQALVRCRGQETLSDGNGGFLLRNVLVNPGDELSVEAGFARATGRVERVQRSRIPAVSGGLTVVDPDLALPAEADNRLPLIFAPADLALNEGETREVRFLAADPDPGQRIQLALSGAGFAVLASQGNDLYTLRLTPRANDAGRYTLRLTATDDAGGVTTLPIALRVNRPPLAAAQSVTTNEDTDRAVTLTASDPDNDPLSFSVVANPRLGTLSGTPPSLIYTPAANANGSDSFTFKVNDGLADSNTATVTILIAPVNDAPVLIAPGPITVDTGQGINFTIAAADVEGDALTFTATGLPGGASFRQVNQTAAQFEWTPSAIQVGGHSVTFTVRDNGSPPLSASRSVAMTVTPRFAPTAALEGGTVFALLSDGTNLFAGTTVGVFRSPNQGQSWTAASTGLPSRFVRALAMSSTNLFAGTQGGGVYVSNNNGQSWAAINTGLPPNAMVRVLALSGTNLFAGTDGGVYLSINQGQSWTAVNTGLTNTRVSALAVSGANLFAGTNGGVFRSTNQGQSWTAVNAGLTITNVQSLAVSGTNLFAGTDGGGVFLSTNNGQSCGAVSIGLTDRSVQSLAVSGANLFAGTNDDGVFLSTNNGQSWAAANAGLTAVLVRALALGGTNLFAGTLGGVYLSINQGQSWTAVNSGLRNRSVQALAISGTNLFAGTTNNGVYLTTNQGQSWIAVNAGLPSVAVPSLAVSGANLFAGTNGSGVYLSTNQGQSWTAANVGLPPNVLVRALAVSGANLFAGTEGNGIFLSTNNGQSWTAVNNGLTNLNVPALAVSGTTLFAGTFGGGVFRSTDQGQSWTSVSLGLPGGLAVYSFAVSGANLFAATEFGGGVYLSANQGQSWTAANSGLANLAVFSLAVSGTNLFAGTASGVFISQ